MNSKTDIWYWQLGVYSPSKEKVIQTGDRCFETTGVKYPYRRGKFTIKWLEPFHPEFPWVWDIYYVKPKL